MDKHTIAIDLAKSVFQVLLKAPDGTTKGNRAMSRSQMRTFMAKQPPSVVAMESCATSQYWAREFLAMGHEVKLLPPQAVKPFVKPGKKNDAADAVAISEAAARPNIHPVPVKTAEEQAILAVIGIRQGLMEQRTEAANRLRAHLAEFGLVAPKGIGRLDDLVATLDADDSLVPAFARPALKALAGQIEDISSRIDALERDIAAWHKTNETSRNLATIPGIGQLTAALLAATVTDPSAFKSGRDFAAWIGLVPSQKSSGGKQRLGRITKAGNRAIRRHLILGATAVIQHAGRKGAGGWLASLLQRKPKKVAAVALANKMARIAWAIMSSGEVFKKSAPVAAAA